LATPGSTFTNAISNLFNPFSLKDIKGFPYLRWIAQAQFYEVLHKWYSGEMLNEQLIDSATGIAVDKYPIKINPLRGTSRKHVSALFGSNIDSIAFGGIPVTINATLKEAESERKQRLDEAIQEVFNASGGGASFIQNGMMSQKYGGCVFHLSFNPENNVIQISVPSPREFIGIPYGTDYWRLREAWIVREISIEDAKAYGVNNPKETQQYYYIEHWTEETYEIMVNGDPIKVAGFEAKGANPYGVVPMVYIPHMREEGFLGLPILTETIRGLILEMNLRWADVGDAVNDDTHGYVAVRNIRGSLKVTGVGDGKKIIDLGSMTGMGGEQNPDMFSVKTSSVAQPMLQYVRDLESLYRREAAHPAVADGEDEGSQRSSLTLTTRMFPLVSEAEMERVFWSIGLGKLVKIMLKIMRVKSLFSITEEDEKVNFLIKWNTMLPRDRDAIVNEAAIRSKNKLGSQKHLIGLFNDVDSIDDELAEIEKEAEAEQERQVASMEAKAKVAAENAPDPATKSKVVTGSKSPDKTDNKLK
jgi:hypothetical protein